MNFGKLYNIIKEEENLNGLKFNNQIRYDKNNSNNGGKEPPLEGMGASNNPNPTPPTPAAASFNNLKTDIRTVMRKLETKLGVEAKRYMPLVSHLYKNEQALRLFDEFVEKIGTTNAQTTSNIVAR